MSEGGGTAAPLRAAAKRGRPPGGGTILQPKLPNRQRSHATPQSAPPAASDLPPPRQSRRKRRIIEAVQAEMEATRRPGLDVSAYACRPRLPKNASGKVVAPRRNEANRRAKWASFRNLKVALRLLAYFGLPRTDATVERATEWLGEVVTGAGRKDPVLVAAIGIGMRRLPAKTIYENSACLCLYERWKTAASKRRSRRRLPDDIPHSWKKMSRHELIEVAKAYRDAFELSEARRRALVEATAPKPVATTAPADVIDARMAELAARMASVEGAGDQRADAV